MDKQRAGVKVKVNDKRKHRSHCDFSPSHAVEDETQEDEGIVAVVNFHILYDPLAHHSKVTWLGELALVHKAGPRTYGQPAPVNPLFGYTG